MRVVLDAQLLCERKLTDGITIFTYNLYKTLINRNKNEYALSFFDKGKERSNREKLKKYFLQGKTLQGKCSKLASFLGSAVVFEPKQLFNVIWIIKNTRLSENVYSDAEEKCIKHKL